MENTVDSGLNKENIPLYMRVYEYYKDLITEGKLSPGARLPSICCIKAAERVLCDGCCAA